MRASNPSLPTDQHWLLNRLLTIIPDGNKEGICFGITQMAIQAILASDIGTFEQRLKLINSIPVESFKQTIEELNQKRVLIIQKVKQQYHSYQLNDIDVQELINQEEVKRKLSALDQTLNLAEYTKRKQSILFNAFLQNKIELKMLTTLSQSERLILDIPVFFEGVQVYQNLEKYSKLFDKYNLPVQDSELSRSLILSKNLENDGGVVATSPIRGLYTVEQLRDLFEGFSESVHASQQKITKPIAFCLAARLHATTVGYDPLEKKWFFINANKLEIPTPRLTAEELSLRILDAYKFSNTVLFMQSTMYVNHSEASQIQKSIEHWKQRDDFIAMHSVSPERANVVDPFGRSWLFLAASKGDREKVKELLAAGALPNQAINNPNHSDDDVTPLMAAIIEGHKQIAEDLLHAGADPNAMKKNGVTPLFMAAQRGQRDTVKLLLSRGANSTLKFKTTVESLLKFARNHQVEDKMKIFIEENTKKKSFFPGFLFSSEIYITPKNIAVIMGHAEIAADILSYGDDTRVATSKLPVDSGDQFIQRKP